MVVATVMDFWNPAQYEKFKDQRLQPFRDLVRGITPVAGMRAVDLGCGTGETTLELHEHTRAGDTLGIDNSPTMLKKTAAFARPGLRFEAQAIEDFASTRAYDLVFSNAALHWVE